MMAQPEKSLLLAAGVGAITGMRSMSAPFFLSRRIAGGNAASRLLGSRRARQALPLLAAGELVADKLPGVPDRTDLAPLAGRAVIGGFCGLAVAGARGGDAVGCTAAGAGAAVVAAFLAHRLRREAGRRTGWPDAVFALLEDAVVMAGGATIAREL